MMSNKSPGQGGRRRDAPPQVYIVIGLDYGAFHDFKPNFLLEAGQMDSNSPAKTLNLILNTLPRTVAP